MGRNKVSESVLSRWFVRLEFLGRVRAQLMGIVQVITVFGVFGASLKKSTVASVVFFVLYILLAWVADLMRLRESVDRSGWKKTDAWPILFKRLDRIEKALGIGDDVG